ncbi:MAG: ATP-binding protein [Pseudomonadota bacterium]
MREDHMKVDVPALVHDVNGVLSRALLAAETLSDHPDPAVAAKGRKIVRALDQAADFCAAASAAARSEATAKTDFAAEDIERVMGHVASLAVVEGDLGLRPVEARVMVAAGSRLRASEDALTRILFNLALNAVDAMARRGGSRLTLSARPTSSRSIDIAVEDDGPGLPPHVISHLFAGGEEAPPWRGRVGTGLVASARLAGEMGGALVLAKTGIAGSRFILRLPMGAARSGVTTQNAAGERRDTSARTP